MIEELVCQGSTDIEDLSDRLPVRYRLREFEYARLIHWSDWRLDLQPEGLPYARSVAAALDRWRAGSATRFSTAV